MPKVDFSKRDPDFHLVGAKALPKFRSICGGLGHWMMSETLNVVEWKRVPKPVVVELREKSPLLCDQGAYRKWIQCRGHPSFARGFP